jgi:hypothetical protein
MSGDDLSKSKEEELAELVKERETIQRETDELMKRRQELLKQDVSKLVKTEAPANVDGSKEKAQSSPESKEVPVSKSEPFELFAKSRDETGKDGEKSRTTRGGFLRSFVSGMHTADL